ncbi:AlpA family phage regulatory protein [Histidinibacterium aquaticum]|uniref:AlpA family phage regulatory protein n=2 Tax=Histidinibacterium aquaticum TaxID=2613962 RepID=A0A5J5GCQ1_9RHOB|nr:AlpA family phage regulatory protein [Histidinibacterium aquaticum]
MTERLLRRPEVERLTGLSRSTIYSMMPRGEFPKPVRIGRRAVAWREGDLRIWVASIASERSEGTY